MSDEDLMKQPNRTTDAEHLDLRSVDIGHQKRVELLQLFPEALTEGGKLDFERLKLTLGEAVDSGKERYGMIWPGKADCFKTIQRPSMGTLRPSPEESVNFDTTENLIIEGDNLEVLKLLQKAYLGKVKMIYIDPPYNTGNDFIYPDNFSESLQTYLEYSGQVDDEGKKFATNTETDGRFHSRWLDMMYPRLFLARNLLADNGVVFVTIDDNEVHNLRTIMNEVFGEENFVASVIWQHSVQPKGYAGKFSVHHNYILVYRRSAAFEVASLERTDEHNKSYSNPDNDPRGLWRTGDVRNALFRPNLRYEITTPSGKKIPPPENGWRWSKETVAEKLRSGEIIFSPDESRIIRKIYLATVDGRVPETIWFGKEVGTTRDAASELKALFGGDLPFDTAKPVQLIKRMADVAGVEADDLIVDFFAGSGTTAHSVLEMNRQDGGNRRFVLVQLPEPVDLEGYRTIADVTKERVRRVVRRLELEESEQLPLKRSEKEDLGFRVFKLADSNFTPWNADVAHDAEALKRQLELHVEHVRRGRTPDDLFVEILLKSGFPLSTPVETVTLAGKAVRSVADGALFVCLENELTLELIRAMADLKPERVVCLDQGFAGADQLKANAVQAFKAKGVTSFKTV